MAATKRTCIDLKLTNPLARKAIAERVEQVKKINADLRERLRRQIRIGFDNGESVADIADRIQKTFKAERGRALTIARTEINGAAADGLESQATLNYGTKYDKEWITSRDARVRDSHYAIDGERIKSTETFANGLHRPHDPLGPPEEVINCRCTLLIFPHDEASQ